jgi:cation:H+ antiporter
MVITLLMLAIGLVLLTAGAESLVRGASNIAARLGIPSLIVGLTIVAFGTSAPEMAVSVAAAWSDQADIALGNVVGSNVFNLLAVLGLASLVSPSGIAVAEQALRFDLPVMVAVAIACLPIFVTGREIARWEGGLFFAYYLAYTAYVVMAAMHHAALDLYGTAMLWFVLPLTGVTLAVLFARDHVNGRGKANGG